ncbi:MerR family DNA-binding protein [Streptomyces sp. NPDC059679]|uniref:MerR family DNA-binding protein n=1 Tax=Streptomyces sp. NPDC059679 TaxID=3346903 RepID=UPI00368AEBB9
MPVTGCTARRRWSGWHFIGAAKHLGLPLDEVGELIGVREGGACAEVKASLRPKIAARLAEAERRTAEVRAFASSLHAALERLDALPDRSGRCDPQRGFLTAPVPVARPTDMVLAPSRQAGEEAEQRKSAAVACSLSGEDMAERASAWHAALDGAERVGIPDGLRLTLPAERAAGITELAVAEQRCCPFFGFRLHLDGPHLHLDVRVPADGAGHGALICLAGMAVIPQSAGGRHRGGRPG